MYGMSSGSPESRTRSERRQQQQNILDTLKPFSITFALAGRQQQQNTHLVLLSVVFCLEWNVPDT
jgi:hypothetical protein